MQKMRRTPPQLVPLCSHHLMCFMPAKHAARPPDACLAVEMPGWVMQGPSTILPAICGPKRDPFEHWGADALGRPGTSAHDSGLLRREGHLLPTRGQNCVSFRTVQVGGKGVGVDQHTNKPFFLFFFFFSS